MRPYGRNADLTAPPVPSPVAHLVVCKFAPGMPARVVGIILAIIFLVKALSALGISLPSL